MRLKHQKALTPKTHCHIPEDMNAQQHYYDNIAALLQFGFRYWYFIFMFIPCIL